jgi:predicted acetyltransferase
VRRRQRITSIDFRPVVRFHLRVKLVVPAQEHLESYCAALRCGWSPDNVRGRAAAEEQLHWIARDSAGFLASLDDPLASGAPIKMANGTRVKRLPSIVRWMWDEEFAGSIGFRWQEGTSALPRTCPGHIGFAVVPWKRERGLAKRALRATLEEARIRGLDYVELTPTPSNLPSQGVIEANGDILVERFMREPQLGGGEALRYRIDLCPSAHGIA